MTDETRARKLANDPRFENALAALQESMGVRDDDLVTVGAISIAITMSVFTAFASILEAKGIAKIEESLDVLVLAMEKTTETAKANLRLAQILDQ